MRAPSLLSDVQVLRGERGKYPTASLKGLSMRGVYLVAEWYAFPFFWVKVPLEIHQPRKGALMIIWLLGYQVNGN